jgi:hypothetical protein
MYRWEALLRQQVSIRDNYVMTDLIGQTASHRSMMMIRHQIPIKEALLCDDAFAGRKSIAISIRFAATATAASTAAPPGNTDNTKIESSDTSKEWSSTLTIASVHWLSDAPDKRRPQQLHSLLQRVSVAYPLPLLFSSPLTTSARVLLNIS